MGNTFFLEIMTPERQFFSGQAEALTLLTTDGEITIMANHAGMVAPIEVGTLRILTDGEWKEAANSEGFLETGFNHTVIFTQSCEWPEEIDIHRAEEAKRRAEELLRQKRSLTDYRVNQLSFARAMMRLRVSKRNGKIK